MLRICIAYYKTRGSSEDGRGGVPMKSGAEKTDGILRGFGSLLSIAMRRHVHFERRPIREVSVSRAWQNVYATT